MTWVYVVLVIFIGNNVKTTAPCLLEKTPTQPQLSTTFMKGYWYQHLFANNLLQNRTCNHFEIICNDSQRYCVIYNYEWIGYLLNQTWNGTITQNKEGVELIIHQEDGGNSTYDVNLKFKNNALLIWSCKNNNIVFASILYRMEVDDEMMNVWEQADIDMSFPDIIGETPAGMWMKIDPRECFNGNTKKVPSWAFILLALGAIILVGNA